MNYNDYDSNGNKKKVDFKGFLMDKQKRAIVILVIYAIIILGVIFLIKTRSTNQNKVNNEVNDNTNKQVVENKEVEKKEANSFTLLDSNNYEFTFTITKNEELLVINGKRYNDKVYLTETHDDVVDEFSGLINEIKLKHTNYSYMNNYYIDILNNDIVKAIINEADNDKISNNTLSKIVNYHDELSNSGSNKVTTIIKNNNITGVEIDISNFISGIEENDVLEIIKLEYNNFGLVDDFDV